MDFCNDCGQQTEPEWVFCRSCGSALDAPEIESPAAAVVGTDAPKVELISRGWDVVDVEASTAPTDPLLDDDVARPLAPGSIEISVDSVTVVGHPEQSEEEDNTAAAATVGAATDRWDHLRPHGQIPGVTEATTMPARISQVGVLIVALAGLVAAGIRFYLNTRLDAFGKGRISGRVVNDVELVADAALFVVAGLAVLAGATLGWWLVKAKGRTRFRPGPAERIALAAGLGGAVLIGIFMFIDSNSVAAAIAANSLVILGLGLVILACLAVVRSLTRIEFESRH